MKEQETFETDIGFNIMLHVYAVSIPYIRIILALPPDVYFVLNAKRRTQGWKVLCYVSILIFVWNPLFHSIVYIVHTKLLKVFRMLCFNEFNLV